MASRRQILMEITLVLGLILLSYKIYRASPVISVCDSFFSLMQDVSLLEKGTLSLNEYLPRQALAGGVVPFTNPGETRPYQLIQLQDRLYYGYPPGSSLLSLPLVWYLRQGRAAEDFDGTWETLLRWNLLAERWIASLLSAVIVGLAYLLARAYLERGPALLLALLLALASPVWSILSRGLWSHTWAVLLMFLLLLLICWLWTRETEDRPASCCWGLALGTLLFWICLVRPQCLLSVAPLGVLLAGRLRRYLATTLLAGSLWVAALVLFCQVFFGQPTPPSAYDPSTIDGREQWTRFVGLMLSPGRGLLVYCPWLAILACGLLAHWRRLPDRALAWAGLGAIATQLLLLVNYDGWWGGSCYGPRYFADVLPWFFFLAVLLTRAVLIARPRSRLSLVVLLAALGWSVFVHARGALEQQTLWWTNRPEIHSNPKALVNDWQYPPFLAGIHYRVDPTGQVQAR